MMTGIFFAVRQVVDHVLEAAGGLAGGRRLRRSVAVDVIMAILPDHESSGRARSYCAGT